MDRQPTEAEVRKFRKNPVVIEAVKYNGDNAQQIADFIECQYPFMDGNTILIGTLEGTHRAAIGDWIIKGIKGEFYPCKPDIFELTYEPVEVING